MICIGRVPSRRLDPPGLAARPPLAAGSPERPRSDCRSGRLTASGGRAYGTTQGRTPGGLDPDPDAIGAERGLRREYERLPTAPYQNIYRGLTKPYLGTVDHQSNQRTPDWMWANGCVLRPDATASRAPAVPRGGPSVSGDGAVSRGPSGSAVRSHRLAPVLHNLGRRRGGDGAAGDRHRRKPSGDGGRAVGSPTYWPAGRGHVENSGQASPSDGTERE
jgi:hypothetical protein